MSSLLELTREHPDLDADLFTMGFDVQAIRTPHDVRRGFALVERLKISPDSVWRAKKLGTLDHFGWDTTAYLVAGLIDAVNNQTKATAQRKASLKSKERIERPKVHQVREFKPRTVAEMDFGVLFQQEDTP